MKRSVKVIFMIAFIAILITFSTSCLGFILAVSNTGSKSTNGSKEYYRDMSNFVLVEAPAEGFSTRMRAGT